MSGQPADIELTVFTAMRSASANPAVEVDAHTEVLQLVGSLGFFMALVDIQHTLNLSLDPEQIVQLFMCHSLGDLVTVLESIAAEAADALVTGDRR